MNENEPNILDMDLGSMKTDMPLVKAGLYDLKVLSAKVEDNNKQDGHNLNITFTNTIPAQSTKDETLPPETARVFHNVSLKTTQKATPEAVARRVAMFIQALTPAVGGVRMSNLGECVNMFVGKVARCKVDVQKERTNKETGETYPERNSIAQFVKV